MRYFAVLGEELNYRRAAERLFITQPALSTAIKQLEHQTGVTLFRRNTRAVALWRSLGFEVMTTLPEGFLHPSLGYVGLHIMYRKL